MFLQNKYINPKLLIALVLVLCFGLGFWVGKCAGNKSYRMDHKMKMNYGFEKSFQKNKGSMDHAMGMMTAGLANKTGAEFDEAFLKEMIVHHEGAVEMAKQVIEKSKRPELLKLANEIIKAQTTEIESMNTWHKLWFNAN